MNRFFILVFCLLITLIPIKSFSEETSQWPEFKFQIDENAGIYNYPRGGTTPGWYFTNNAFLRLYYQPKILIKQYYGMAWHLSLWLRTTDINLSFSRTVLRPFAGPVLYGRLVDNETFRLQANESPNIFWGQDLNGAASKRWQGWELGNYASLEATYKPAALSLDAHNWYVRGLNIQSAGVDAKEDGLIFGSTLSWVPFSIWRTEKSFINSLSLYARFREWAWQVQPTGTTVTRKWWEEITFGFKTDFPFSIFE